MKVDLTVTISVILGCAAVISPVLTALINNAHQSAMRRQDAKREKYHETVAYKRKIIEEYIQRTAVKIQVKNLDTNIEYASGFGLAAIYVPEQIRNKMIEIDNLIIQQDRETADRHFKQLLPELIAIVQSL